MRETSLLLSIGAFVIAVLSYLFPRKAEPSVSWKVDTHPSGHVPTLTNAGFRSAYKVQVHAKSNRIDQVLINVQKWDTNDRVVLSEITKTVGDFDFVLVITWKSKIGFKHKTKLNW